MAGAFFTALHAVAITRELSPPALQVGKAHAMQFGKLARPCVGPHRGIEDLQDLPGMLQGRQWSPSSPQKAWIHFAAYCCAVIGYSRAAASARAFSLPRNSCCSRLVSRWSCWWRFSRSFRSAIVSSGYAIGIHGRLAPAVHMLGEQAPLTAVSTQFSGVQAAGILYHHELVGRAQPPGSY